jgi:hypothetical protein
MKNRYAEKTGATMSGNNTMIFHGKLRLNLTDFGG